jgi:4-amino-4-deoxy-L-arabinose transferase-like glycosyltransferase
MMRRAARPVTEHAALLVLAVAWLAATAWLRPLMLPDEGRYIGVAWEMLRSGHWLTPTLDGLPYFHKPPLFYWITAASLRLFGMSEWAARLAPLLGAAAGASALFLFARRWADQRVAALALLVLVTQPLFFFGAQFANLDMLVAGCIGAAILAFAHAALGAAAGAPRQKASLAIGYLFAALGVLAKGLIGAVLPGLVILAWLLVLRRQRAVLSLLWLPGIALFLAVAGPWFVAMQGRFPDFSHYFIVVQHFGRYAQAGFNNAQPFWFFPLVLAVLALPWSPWLARATRRAYWDDAERGPVRKLMWLWLVIVTVFFSLPQSKLVGYILPVTLPLAFLAADSAVQLRRDSSWWRRLWGATAILATVCCLALAGLAAAYPQRSTRELARALQSRILPGDRVLFLHQYYFDLPFYAGLRAPVAVADDWGNPDVSRHDNWRKELADAGQFAPEADRQVLLPRGAVMAALCASPITWLVAPKSMIKDYPELQGAAPVFETGSDALWRVRGGVTGDLGARACLERPSADSADKS